MTDRRIARQVTQLVSHVVDSRGYPEAKMVRAVAKAVAASKWPHRTLLLREFARRIRQLESARTAVVTTAEPLSAEQQREVAQLVTGSRPQIVAFDWRTDPSIIAGMTIKAGDSWFDVSIKQRLTQVQENLG
jgi:F0F1-type ATP synthase delta subunit